MQSGGHEPIKSTDSLPTPIIHHNVKPEWRKFNPESSVVCARISRTAGGDDEKRMGRFAFIPIVLIMLAQWLCAQAHETESSRVILKTGELYMGHSIDSDQRRSNFPETFSHKPFGRKHVAFIVALIVSILSTVSYAQTEVTGQSETDGAETEDAMTETESSYIKDATMEEVLVIVAAAKRGHGAPLALSNTPAANPASVTVLTQDDIANKTTSNVADLLRGSNGIQVSDYGQVGEPLGVTMRGWANGYDSAFIGYFQDGFQRNQVTHIGVNGFLDLNPLIPETVQNLTIVRGPFDVRYGGNLAQAGSIVVATRNSMPSSFHATAGSFGLAKMLGVIGGEIGDADFYTAIQGERTDGYRDRSDGKVMKSFTKLSTQLAGGDFSLGVETYYTDFNQPGYIPLSQIKDGAISKRSAVSNTDGGSVESYTFTSRYFKGDSEQGLEINAGAMYSSADRIATTIPYPQYYRADKRWVIGGGLEVHKRLNWSDSVDMLLLGGISMQNSKPHLDELPSSDGNPMMDPNPFYAYFFRDTDLTQNQTSAYLSLQVKPADWIKFTAGVRYDHFDFNITDTTYLADTNTFATNKYKSKMGRFSPKVGLAINPIQDITLYFNYGESPRSPSGSTEVPKNPDLDLSYLRSYEAGIAYDPWEKRLHFQLNFYDTVNADEIGQIGYEVINFGESKREGFDFETALDLVRSQSSYLKLTGNYSKVKARLDDGVHVPFVAEWLAAYGLRAEFSGSGENMVRVDLDHEFFGPQTLDALGSSVAKEYNRLTGKARYIIPEMNNLNLFVGAIYYPGSVYNEFSFELGGEIYTAPAPKFQIQVGASIEF